MKHQNVLKASKTEEILALVKGLPVNQSGYFLTEEQMTNIDAALAANNSASLQELLTKAQADLANATKAKETAEAALATANATIVTQKTKIENLESEDGKKIEQKGKDKDDPQSKDDMSEFRCDIDDEYKQLNG